MPHDASPPTLLDCFSALDDPRQPGKTLYPLEEILLLYVWPLEARIWVMLSGDAARIPLVKDPYVTTGWGRAQDFFWRCRRHFRGRIHNREPGIWHSGETTFRYAHYIPEARKRRRRFFADRGEFGRPQCAAQLRSGLTKRQGDNRPIRLVADVVRRL